MSFCNRSVAYQGGAESPVSFYPPSQQGGALRGLGQPGIRYRAMDEAADRFPAPRNVGPAARVPCGSDPQNPSGALSMEQIAAAIEQLQQQNQYLQLQNDALQRQQAAPTDLTGIWNQFVNFGCAMTVAGLYQVGNVGCMVVKGGWHQVKAIGYGIHEGVKQCGKLCAVGWGIQAAVAINVPVIASGAQTILAIARIAQTALANVVFCGFAGGFDACVKAVFSEGCPSCVLDVLSYCGNAAALYWLALSTIQAVCVVRGWANTPTLEQIRAAQLLNRAAQQRGQPYAPLAEQPQVQRALLR